MSKRGKRKGGPKILKNKKLRALKRVRKKTAAKALLRSKSHSKAPLKPQKLAEDPRLKLAREQYETGLSFLNGQKYEKAIPWFEKVMASPVGDLIDRARMHISICRKRLEGNTLQLRTSEDHYNYAVSQINVGQFSAAEEHLGRAMKQTPKAGHLHYAMATVKALKSELDAALGSLKAAIDLDESNRFMARNDRDFAALYEDPRFADLVYPEKGSEG